MPGPLTQVERERIDALVSSRVGLIRSLGEFRSMPDEPSPPILYTATLADFDLRCDGDDHALIGVGKGDTAADAIRRAVGEAVERYCCAHADFSRMVVAPERELGVRAVSPVECVLYSAAQYDAGDIRYPRYDDERSISWVSGRSLVDGAEVFVPGSLTYLSFRGEFADETWCYNTSNGVAAGPDLATAQLNGLYELIERDGYLIAWMNRLPVARVDFEDTGGLPGTIRRHYELRGIDVHVFDVSSDIPVPVLLAIAVDQAGPGPAAVVGLGCDLDPNVALTKALLELCQGRMGESWRHRNRRPDERIRSVAEVRRIRDHSALFAEPDALTELAFLLETPRTIRLGEIPNHATGDVSTDLSRCVEFLVRAGSRVAYVDITTPDVASVGLWVVRTIATELQPIHFGYRAERLGGRRVFEVPRRLGYRNENTREEDLNRCPHPLP